MGLDRHPLLCPVSSPGSSRWHPEVRIARRGGCANSYIGYALGFCGSRWLAPLPPSRPVATWVAAKTRLPDAVLLPPAAGAARAWRRRPTTATRRVLRAAGRRGPADRAQTLLVRQAAHLHRRGQTLHRSSPSRASACRVRAASSSVLDSRDRRRMPLKVRRRRRRGSHTLPRSWEPTRWPASWRRCCRGRDVARASGCVRAG